MPYDISVVIALVFIIWSVREDVKAFRIPNYLIIAGLIVGTGLLVIRGLAGDNIRDYILGTLAGLAGMMLLYIIRAVGAGDVKLFAVLGQLTGLEFVVQLMVVSFITGLFIGVIPHYRRLRNEALAEDTKAVRDEMNELLAQYRREKENAETR